MSMIKRKHVITLFVMVLLSFGVIFLLFSDINILALKGALLSIKLGWIILAVVALVMYWLVETLILFLIIRSTYHSFPIGSTFKITMVGQLFNLLTPSSAGGQPAQLYMLYKRNVNGSFASSILMIKFIIYQLVLVLLLVFIFSLRFHQLAEAIPEMKYIVYLGLAIQVAVVVVLVCISLNKPLVLFTIRMILLPVNWIKKSVYTKWKNRAEATIETFHQESRRLMKNKSLMLSCSVLTIVQLVAFLVIPFFIFKSLGNEQLPFLTSVSFHAFIMMFSSVIPTPGGTGAAEYSFTLLFDSLTNTSDLLLGVLLWRMLTVYTPIILGALLMIMKSKLTRHLISKARTSS